MHVMAHAVLRAQHVSVQAPVQDPPCFGQYALGAYVGCNAEAFESNQFSTEK